MADSPSLQTRSLVSPLLTEHSSDQLTPLTDSALPGEGFDEVATTLEALVQAPERCQAAPFYIQAVVSQRRAFLATNLNAKREIRVTRLATVWSVGRNLACAIAIPHTSISRCHAVLGYCIGQGFYITDTASKNGTWLNQRRLEPTVRHQLRDGDLLRLGILDVEFFVTAPSA